MSASNNPKLNHPFWSDRKDHKSAPESNPNCALVTTLQTTQARDTDSKLLAKSGIEMIGIKLTQPSIYDSKEVIKTYLDYRHLTAINKIALIKNAILNICQQLQKTHPESMWIIAWQEGMIREAGSNYLEEANEELLIQTMNELTAAFPLLAIASGTTLVKRPVTALNHPTITAEAKERFNQVAKLLPEFQRSTEWYHFSKANPEIPFIETEPMKFLQNKFRLSQGGKTVGERAKIIAFQTDLVEVDDTEKSYVIFHPGRLEDTSFEVTHPITKVKFRIAVDICLEHSMKLLKTLQNSAAPPNPSPWVQLVLSDATCFIPDACVGENTFYLDSRQALAYRAKQETHLVHLNEFDLLEFQQTAQSTLKVIKPLTNPLVIQLKDLLTQLINLMNLPSSEIQNTPYFERMVYGLKHLNAMKLLLNEAPKKHTKDDWGKFMLQFEEIITGKPIKLSKPGNWQQAIKTKCDMLLKTLETKTDLQLNLLYIDWVKKMRARKATHPATKTQPATETVAASLAPSFTKGR